MAKRIALTNGGYALVDDEDAQRLSKYSWTRVSGTGYARRATTVGGKGGRKVVIYMHREVVGAPRGTVVDHVNHDKLDNRRANLRVCTHKENCRRQRPQQGKTSAFRGVHLCAQTGRWRAVIVVDGARVHLGRFDNPREAAVAYDAAALKYFGDFAHLNLAGAP